jgi:hypothetical protein
LSRGACIAQYKWTLLILFFWNMTPHSVTALWQTQKIRRPGFDPGSVHVGFVLDKVEMGQVFLQLISFHQCSIRRENRKKQIIFITGLHNKPQGCGAHVASATGTFTPGGEALLATCVSGFMFYLLEWRSNYITYTIITCFPNPRNEVFV